MFNLWPVFYANLQAPFLFILLKLKCLLSLLNLEQQLSLIKTQKKSLNLKVIVVKTVSSYKIHR